MQRLSRLKEHRERRGLTQMELAALSGVSRATIATLEADPQRRAAYPSTARKLAKALKVSVEALGPPRPDWLAPGPPLAELSAEEVALLRRVLETGKAHAEFTPEESEMAAELVRQIEEWLEQRKGK